MKIAIGGFQHETNSFATSTAPFEEFVAADGWPGLCRGEAIFDQMPGRALPIAGFLSRAARRGATLLPLTWANARPSGPVTDDAFERISAMLIDDLTRIGSVDAVYLDLHGAMVTASAEDGEGKLLTRLRRVVGPETKVVASLDLHANVTRQMIEKAYILTAYRTYPHIDMAETGARAADLLLGPALPGQAFAQISYLIPITAQCTFAEPAASLYAALERIERETGAALSFTPGFPPADIQDCGPAVFAYAATDAIAAEAVRQLVAVIEAAEPIFARDEILSPEAAIARAQALSGDKPVIIADTQDNPGAGGSSDTTGMLRALLAANPPDAVLALMQDPEAARAAHQAGVGATLDLSLGGKGFPGDSPVTGPWQVLALGSGQFIGTGPMFEGGSMDLGPMARLRRGGVEVLVGSRRQQPSTQAMFRHLGIEPAERKILVLKSSVHFRADFQPMAAAILVAAAPGANTADPAALPYQRLRPGIRRRPQG